MGKLRESLTVSAELYKNHVLRYLAQRHYSLKAGSDVEATLADSILTRIGENRDYWLEAKETAISLGDSSFLSQLAKYLSLYLSRTPKNRFKMIIACYRILNAPLFEKVYDKLDPESISTVVSKMVETSPPDINAVIADARIGDIKEFFEETTVIEADLKQLEIAQEKLKPISPTAQPRPSLPEAEYATKVQAEFGDIAPSKSSDEIFLNLFHLLVPSRIHIAKTLYRTGNDLFSEKPNTSFPAFDLDNGLMCTFNEYAKESPLSDFVILESHTSIELSKFVENEQNERIVIKILNRWIKQRCRKRGLLFDDRTKAYYYPKASNGDGLVTAKWKPKNKDSIRELTKPMKNEGRINFWVHRAASISAKSFWGGYYIQIRPRFLFSTDGTNLLESDKTDRLDRDFRKSIYSRNLNQLYDVRFWHRHVFPETENLGTASLDKYLGFETKQSIKVLEQVKVEGECKPNIEVAEKAEELDKIEPAESEARNLDDYFGS